MEFMEIFWIFLVGASVLPAIRQKLLGTYGSLNRDSVVTVRSMIRRKDGRFD
jgi:hypothetical protein